MQHAGSTGRSRSNPASAQWKDRRGPRVPPRSLRQIHGDAAATAGAAQEGVAHGGDELAGADLVNPASGAILSTAGADAGDSLGSLALMCADCQACPLADSRRQVVVGRGHPQARLLLVGEAPGAEEDVSGRPFVGRSGRLLDRLLAEAGLDRERDLYIANIVKCRPPQNRRPTAAEMAACRPWLDRQLALLDPPLILLAGATALAGLLGIRSGISRLRGQWQTWQGRQLLPLFHPAYLLRNPRRGPGQPIDLTVDDLIAARERLRALTRPDAG